MLNQRDKSNKVTSVAKESISLTTVFLIVFSLFATLCIGILFFRFSPDSPLSKYYLKKPEVKNLSSYVADQSNNSASGATVEVKITRDQLAEAICLKCSTFPLKKPEMEINQNGIILEGKTASGFWGIKMEFTIIPKIILNSLSFEVTDVKAAGVKAPSKLTDPLNPKINDVFANALPKMDDVTLLEIRPMVDYLFLEGKKK